MHPSEAISALKEAGLSETEIATAVQSSQPTINRIGRGETQPHYALGKALVDLAKKKKPRRARAA